MTLRERLAINLKRIMKLQGLTIPALVKICEKKEIKLSLATIGNLRNNNYAATLDTVEQVAEALGVTAVTLLM